MQYPSRPSEPTSFIEVRGPSGRLYGRLDVARMVLEVKRKGEPSEEIDLRRYLQPPHLDSLSEKG